MMMVVVMMMVMMALRIGHGGRCKTSQKRECKKCLFHNSSILL